MAVFRTSETAPGEYGDLFEFLMEELKLFKRKLVLMLKHVQTGESMVYEQAWYDFHLKERLTQLMKADDYAAIAQLPINKNGQTGIYIETRYVKSGKLVGLQLVEARPHEGGRYVGLTPAVVFTDADGERMLPFAQKLK
ncbi:hypothetical protein [Variovorax guangxiensis]|uniref:Uncharacterized protein n=1 Tax=Variovorax guangxiensis TaxID=1775474 RepID=A0A502DWS2_9BURK|nr:hypothetical protein [Variovorax guangxiensis]RZI66395.1 MAG: hypothetical protein EOP79_07840 [Variovorax sp.]TPG26222.1 hypothetical protein EAH83_00065 [Variovorax ginsengisoli]TPG29945.1 hypothetical protein EAH82_00065 [Variovorax guangxiensis]